MLLVPLLFALAAPGAAAPHSAGGVNHCIDAAGVLVYTDKPCAAVHARRLDEGDARGPFLPAYRNGCIASLREFAYELSSAVEAGDVNRLAALYRWRGTSTQTGYSIMERLRVIAGRSLLQVDPVYPSPPRPPAPAAPRARHTVPATGASAAAAQAVAAPGFAAFPEPSSTGFDASLPDPPRRGPPIGLRLDQTLADGVTPAATTLWLRRELGCWWVTL